MQEKENFQEGSQEKENSNKRGLSRRGFLLSAVAAFGAATVVPAVTMTEKALGSTGTSVGEGHKKAWWVKTVDKPTIEIDISKAERMSNNNTAFNLGLHFGPERAKEITETYNREVSRLVREKVPGYKLKDRILYEAGWTINRAGTTNKGIYSWTPIRVVTPETLQVDKYQESPEEAARDIKAAARAYGAATVGIAEMNEKYIYSEAGKQKFTFEEVEQPYETEEKFVIPKKCKWVIALTVQMSLDNLATAPTATAGGTVTTAYSRAGFLVSTLAEFIRGLGYIAIPSVNDVGPSIPFAINAGLGEMGRFNRMITPEYGPMVRVVKVITDLPMALDKPIDFGAMEFCKTCKKCAEACPSGALSMETEPTWEPQGKFSVGGKKTWYENSAKCLEYWRTGAFSGCSICFAVCPYSKQDKTMVHEMVKATTATTTAFNATFNNMDNAFGYGAQRDPEEWWTLDLAEYGVDSTRGHKDS